MYSFFSLYIDGFKYEEAEIPNERPEIDQWIISELNTKEVDGFMPIMNLQKQLNSEFVQENLSNWYVRLCRRRFKGEYAQDKIAAYQTLYTCLLTISKLGAPIAPFFMDKLYRDLTVAQTEKFDSVHLAKFQFRLKTMLIKY
jgi:isoleucyl-tRNA synthetase